MRLHGRRASALLVAPLLLGVLQAVARADTGAIPAGNAVTVGLALDRSSRPDAAGDLAVGYLHTHHFTVTEQSRWLITATGDAGLAHAAFGGGVPLALQGAVSAVVGLDTTSRWRPHVKVGGLTAADLRSAYQVFGTGGSAAGMTVATAQFSGWLRTDLETYAAGTGVPMPSVTERPVGGADPTAVDGTGDEVEVALDHEALLAAAPGAAQVIFFGHNTDLGAVQMYDAIATAAEHDEFDVLSLSWGQCEFEMSAGAMRAINDAMARIVAAGKTVFAAAGDSGVLDCVTPRLQTTAAVDFPASSPYVVGVGGTRIDRGADGSWSEVGWQESVPGSSAAGGGGFSTVFARPSWQPASLPQEPAGAKGRIVPDIAAVADPRSDFHIFAGSHGGWVGGGGTSLASPVTAGHFAATLAAAGKRKGLGRPLLPILYANPQAFRDVVEGDNFGYAAGAGYDPVSGLGAPLWDRLLPLLTAGPIVSVPVATSSLAVPVTIALPAGRVFARYRICESNADAHCDTPDLAPDAVLNPAGAPVLLRLSPGRSRLVRVIVVGFDAAGLEFPGAAYTIYDATPPVVSAAVRLTSANATVARFSWGAQDPPPGVGVARYEAVVTRYGSVQPLRSFSGASTSWTATLIPGAIYTLQVRASDKVGNVSAWKSAQIAVPLDQTQLNLAGDWVSRRAPAAYQGSVVSSSTGGTTATIAVRGSSVDLMVDTGPTGGLVDVFVSGAFSARVDTYSGVPRRQLLVRVASWPGPAPRVIVVRVVGEHSRSSSGSVVTVDGLRVNWR
ncbi:MAG: S53 family peptidase [Actinomycetota bacterium]